MATLISDKQKRQVDEATAAVAILDAALKVLYSNGKWPASVNGITDAPKYLTDAYEAATLLQGVQEVLEKRISLFTRRCKVRRDPSSPGTSPIQITVLPCILLDGSLGAEIWAEEARDLLPPPS